ncbi:MAG: DUF499 domain-containing protein [Pseudomonadota bacterium]
MSGVGGELNSVIRLDTQYGGGKTHALIALIHAVGGLLGVVNPDEFVHPAFIPRGKVRVAALDGENADPANGLKLEQGLFAHSLWGQMAYQLAGREGFERLRQSDEHHVAPGGETISELFGNEPTLILMDEVSVYLRKVVRVFPDAANQFTAFMHALIKAVSSTPKAALVCTLALGADHSQASDAYHAEHQIAVAAFKEAESVIARTLLQIDPTEEDETIDVLRRRLFESVDLAEARDVMSRYFALWDRNRDSLAADAFSPDLREQFKKGYPLHPETLNVMIEKMSSLSTFQRTRGMLRLLARTVQHLWEARPADAYAIHPHHINPEHQAIRGEFLTKLNQSAYAPALTADVAAVSGTDPSSAMRLDLEMFPGQVPVTSYVARTIFINTMAFGEAAQGIKPEHLRYSVCSPSLDPALVETARKAFIQNSLYLDDRPGAPMRFRVEPNLTQIINRHMKEVDPDDLRNNLRVKIKDLFAVKKGDFELVPFPSSQYDIPDDLGGGRPYLVVLHYDALTMSDSLSALPAELIRYATRKGAGNDIRLLQNNLIFVAANDRLSKEMKQAMRRKLALEDIINGRTLSDLADYQQRKVLEDAEKSKAMVAIAIMQCYRHLFYPSSSPVGTGEAKLGHTVIELQNASDSPGNGQLHIKRALQEQKKLLAGGDQPDSPAYVRDQTPLNTKGYITTSEMRGEYRKAPKLSILLDDDPFIKCIRNGIEQGIFIYRKGDQVWGKGDPAPSIELTENAFVHTLAHAKTSGLWPRPEPKPAEPVKPSTAGSGPKGGPYGIGGDPSGFGGEGRTEAADGGVTPYLSSVSAQGPLRQALIELFEKARKQAFKALGTMTIRLFEHAGAKFLHQALVGFKEADITHEFNMGIEADGIDALTLEFRGRLDKANVIRSNIEPLLRTANSQTYQGSFFLVFKPLLSTDQTKAEAFIKMMTNQGGAEAFIEAEAATEN